MRFEHAEAPALDDFGDNVAEEEKAPEQPFVRAGSKVGSSDPCPCGSGKKYKQCHGKLS